MKPDRRSFLSTASLAASAFAFGGPGLLSSCQAKDKSSADSPFRISLAQWSLHRALKSGELKNIDWPAFTRKNFGIDALEWVNSFFSGEPDPKLGIQPKEQSYLAEMKQRCEDHGIASLLIMCDRVGQLGHPDTERRTAAVEGHLAWLDAAKFLGCHSIRVNAASDARLSPEEQADLCADGLARLSEKAAGLDLNVIVENHGGLSSNGAWLARVMRTVDRDNCGTLPDFGNFYVVKNRGDEAAYTRAKGPYLDDPSYEEDDIGLAYDRYLGVEELMPYAKGVSAKAHDFDEKGNEIHTDFHKMMTLVKDAGYTGHVGIEYEGKQLGEVEGIKKTKALLERVFVEI